MLFISPVPWCYSSPALVVRKGLRVPWEGSNALTCSVDHAWGGREMNSHPLLQH